MPKNTDITGVLEVVLYIPLKNRGGIYNTILENDTTTIQHPYNTTYPTGWQK